MEFPQPQPAMVLRYSYLWHREHITGQDAGLKDRPAVVILATEIENNEFIVTVAPITSAPPDDLRSIFEIPLQTKERLGLDHRKSYVVLTEVNRFRWPGPDLRPADGIRFHYGFLATKTFRRLKSRVEEEASKRRLRFVMRTE